MTTKAKLAEQILRLYKGGEISSDNSLSLAEVKLLVGQTLNRLLKIERLQTQTQLGQEFPEHTSVATYTNLTVTQDFTTGEYYTTLPVYPISLPNNMGIWHISLLDDVDTPFIPIPSSSMGLLKNLPTGAMQGMTGYEVNGNRITFKTDYLFSSNEKLLMRLLVVDVDSLTDYNPLPIPPDMEDVVIKEVLTLLGAMQVQEDIVPDSNDQA
jgi:hypothetical protein